MEPATALATVALAAATILPTGPGIEVILQSVDNRTNYSFQCSRFIKQMGGHEVSWPIATLPQGYNRVDEALIFVKQSDFLETSALEMISEQLPNSYLQLLVINYTDGFDLIQIALTRVQEESAYLSSNRHLSQSSVERDHGNAPRDIRVEIDVTIEGDDLMSSRVQEEHEMFWKEKLK